MDPSISNVRTGRGVWLVFFIITIFTEITLFNANSIDPGSDGAFWVYTVCQCLFYDTLGINCRSRLQIVNRNTPRFFVYVLFIFKTRCEGLDLFKYFFFFFFFFFLNMKEERREKVVNVCIYSYSF